MIRRRSVLGAGAGAALAAAAGATLGTAVPARAEGGEDTAALGGVTVTAKDPRYKDLRSGMNQRWAASPEYIVLPRRTADVVAAVHEAVAKGKRITVTSGGHCFEDFVFNPDVAVILNLSLMNSVTFDRKMQAFCVEAGAALLDVYEALYSGWGVVIPAGICHSVGVGGHVTGGGFGLLSRQHGLVIDHLHAVEVVVVDAQGSARSVVATRHPKDPNHDLFWAHAGGGGGNFGVVTKCWFRTPGASGGDPRGLLPNPPAEVFATNVSWPWSKVTKDGFSKLLAYYAQWLERTNTPGTTRSALFPWMLLNHRESGSMGVIIQLDATLPGAAQVLSDYLAGLNDALGVGWSPVKRAGVVDSEYSVTQRLPWLRATRWIGSLSPTQTDPTMRGKHKSAHLKKPMPQAHVDAIYEHLTGVPSPGPYAGVNLSPEGGKIGSVSPTATAVAQRDSIIKLEFETYWHDQRDDDKNVAWLRKTYSAVYADTGGVPVPNSVTDGCYINYPDADLNDPRYNRSTTPWHDLYYKGNYKRLQEVKRAWDPRNVFHHRQSVQP
ncbi:FAD-binding protein [Streptomyces sp. XH2]|uniref:FAD-binding protein n=1 Tax=Streptomyces sp. XH2 TaxID=3412483 RepID=UPI003C7D8EBB